MSVLQQLGSFPVYKKTNGETRFLLDHDVAISMVTTEQGSFMTAPLKTDGVEFNLSEVFGDYKKFDNVIVDKLYYRDLSGKMQSKKVPTIPQLYKDMAVFKSGYTTKINNLRWGYCVTIKNDGTAKIWTDSNSPICGVSIRFTM